MNSGLLQALVEEDSGYKNEGRWGRSEDHSSLVVNEDTQRWYWNAENMGGDALSYLIQVRKLPKKKAMEILEIRGKIVNGSVLNEKRKMDDTPYEKLVDVLWNFGKNHREYWYKRCLTDKTIDRYRLGYFNGWSLIPLREDGAFLNFQCRRDEPTKFIKYWYDNDSFEPVLLNRDMLNLVDTVYITEGPVDSLLLTQEGIPSISQTGGSGYWNGEWYPYFQRVKNIFYIADNDKAGYFGAYRVANYLGVDKVKVFLFDPSLKQGYDTGDYFRDGGNAKDFKQMVEDTARHSFEIGELNNNGKRKGYPAFRRGDRESKRR